MSVQVGDVIRVTAVLDDTLAGTVQNVWHARQFSTATSDSTFIADAAARLETVYGYWDQYMPDTCNFDEIRFFNVTQGTPMTTVPWPTLVSGGVDVADPLPSVLSVLAFARTSVSRTIARKFIGPFTEADQADGEWGAGMLANIALGFGAWWSGWTSGTGLATGTVWSPTTAQYFDITTQAVRAVVAYQRRRKRGRGA